MVSILGNIWNVPVAMRAISAFTLPMTCGGIVEECIHMPRELSIKWAHLDRGVQHVEPVFAVFGAGEGGHGLSEAVGDDDIHGHGCVRVVQTHYFLAGFGFQARTINSSTVLTTSGSSARTLRLLKEICDCTAARLV
jgi:hypothetical protein